MSVDSHESSRVSDEEFMAQAKRVRTFVGVDDTDISYATESAQRHGLEPREQQLLAIETAFFSATIPDTVRVEYWDRYFSIAEKIIHGVAQDINGRGWRLRWGATIDDVNKACEGHIAAGASYEGLHGAKAHGLRSVIFNFANEEILESSGVCLRKLGRYSVAGVQ